MMGHSVERIRDREVYGDEMALADKLALALLVALEVPPHLA